jgi:hypothetical protein
MSTRFVRFIKTVTPREFFLMVREALLLQGREDAEFLLLDVRDLVWGDGGQIIAVGKLGEGFLTAQAPG